MTSAARGALAPPDLQALLAARSAGLLGTGDMRNYQPSLRDRLAEAAANAGRSMGLGDIIAQRMRDEAAVGADFMPGLGAAIGGEEAGRDLGAGNYLSGGLGLAMSMIPGGNKVKGAAKKGIRAYHGSPHSFDQFDMSKIGTGEGAQAYGHGLYFAENEGVAKAYRDDLTALVNASANNEVAKAGGDIDAAIAEAKRKIDHYKNLTGSGDEQRRAGLLQINEQKLSQLMALKEGGAARKGSMYEVNINANPDDFLDWDKPLGQQPESVRAAIEAHPNARRLTGNDMVRGQLSAPTGENIYRRFLTEMDSSRDAMKPKYGEEATFAKASELARRELTEAGIPGIKYLDAGSRAAGDGSRNYVVFDDKLIEIVKKYGIAATLGAGLITQEMAAQMQEQGIGGT